MYLVSQHWYHHSVPIAILLLFPFRLLYHPFRLSDNRHPMTRLFDLVFSSRRFLRSRFSYHFSIISILKSHFVISYSRLSILARFFSILHSLTLSYFCSHFIWSCFCFSPHPPRSCTVRPLTERMADRWSLLRHTAPNGPSSSSLVPSTVCSYCCNLRRRSFLYNHSSTHHHID